MAKNSDRLLKMSGKEIYRQYIWENDKREWMNLVLHKFLQIFRPILFVILMVSPVVTIVNTLADGTDNRRYIALQVNQLQEVLPKLEKAYNDIDKLSKSISKISHKDLDKTFIYSFFIIKWAKHYGVDPIEVAAIIQTESEFNQYALSKTGSKGFTQVNTDHWPMSNPYDGEENIKKGVKILYLYKNSHPSSYLNAYSGGALNYEQKVLKNIKRIKNS